MTQEKLENRLQFPVHDSMEFFGKMSGSATHEIKNILAIINENAGLLEDLCAIAGNGTSLSPEKVHLVSGKIKNQVVRADQTLKRLNQFSHSVDGPRDIINLQDTVRFITGFGSRLLERFGCKVQVIDSDLPVCTSGNLFDVKHLIWRAIESVCYNNSHNNRITISFYKDKTNPVIWFTPDCHDKCMIENLFKSPGDQELITRTGVSILKKQNNGVFGLCWPDSN